MADIILSVVVEVAKCLAPPIYCQMSYLRKSKYTSNLQNLKTEVGIPEAERVSKQREVDKAKRRGEEIEEYVEKWLTSVNGIIDEAGKFTGVDARANKRCFKGLCPNLKTRRRLSKEAERQKEAIVKVREVGRFDRISYNIIPDDTLLLSIKDYEACESRMSTLNDILDALKNPDVNMLGIYGMGGIVKTTLAKEVARKAETEKLFDQVIFVEVSKIQDIRKIQGEIADKLGLTLHEESDSGRARSLRNRLKKEKTILVILDNIWGNLDFQAVGIPHGDDRKGCKVLLTARSLDVLSRKMDSQQNFSVGVLKEDEAWSLFKKMAGDYIEGSEFKWVAKDVARECAGIKRMEVARARVHTLVHKLKASCMLLDDMTSSNEDYFSMHDVVRDVAISIASRELNVFTAIDDVVDREWSEASAIKLYTSIVLPDVKTNVLPEVLECPQLKLFHIRVDRESSTSAISDNFFSRMTQVRVIGLTYMNLLSLPSSLGLLTNLQTLCLYYCKLQDTSVVGDLKNLEILCLRGCDITQLAVQVGQLTQLKLLDLRNCFFLKVIPPNVLSKLSRLEELYIGGDSFNKWEVEVVDGVKNASLDELKHLPNLTSLELQIKDVDTQPRGLFFKKLERFRIHIGGWLWRAVQKSCREFRLKLNTKICLKDGLIVQLQGIEDLELSGLLEQDVNYLVNELAKAGSSQLKHLSVRGLRAPAPNPTESEVALPKLETLYLSSINIERIWQNQVAAMSCGFQNLKRLILLKCWNLTCLFTSSIISSFVGLQCLEICECPVLKEIIVIDQEEIKNNIVMFPKLQYLKIRDLRKLTSFCTGDLHIEFPFLKELQILRCPEFLFNNKRAAHELTKKMFPTLEGLRVDAKHMATICQLPEDFICKLKCLEVMFDGSTTTSSLDFLQRFHTINVDAGFRFSSFYDQDLCSINFITTKRSPRKASSPEVPAHTDKSEYAGYFPGANPPTLKSDMKASSKSQFSTFFETVRDSDCCVMGKRGILRVTPRFWGKRGCRGSVRSCFRFLGDGMGLRLLRYAALWANVGSCVFRRGSGESVAVVPRFSGRRACLANCRRPGLLASRPLAGMVLCLLQEIGLADDVLVDEQDISAPVPPRTRLLRNTPVRRTLPSDICSPCLVSSTYFSQTPVPQFLVLGNVMDQQ
ncbi:AAA domain-containing protein [Citrus sinensis]|uniref:AAA domain-containing protein n=1 Tax=Citrus sinensis TaxID=2711 RepID=A0ACB8KIE7_CITSI|nr:AAA domain-containing protein [Citrus sinensis]